MTFYYRLFILPTINAVDIPIPHCLTVLSRLQYKKVLTLMIDVFHQRNVTIHAQFIQIKIDMPDVIKFGISKNKL